MNFVTILAISHPTVFTVVFGCSANLYMRIERDSFGEDDDADDDDEDVDSSMYILHTSPNT